MTLSPPLQRNKPIHTSWRIHAQHAHVHVLFLCFFFLFSLSLFLSSVIVRTLNGTTRGKRHTPDWKRKCQATHLSNKWWTTQHAHMNGSYAWEKAREWKCLGKYFSPSSINNMRWILNWCLCLLELHVCDTAEPCTSNAGVIMVFLIVVSAMLACHRHMNLAPNFHGTPPPAASYSILLEIIMYHHTRSGSMPLKLIHQHHIGNSNFLLLDRKQQKLCVCMLCYR